MQGIIIPVESVQRRLRIYSRFCVHGVWLFDLSICKWSGPLDALCDCVVEGDTVGYRAEVQTGRLRQKMVSIKEWVPQRGMAYYEARVCDILRVCDEEFVVDRHSLGCTMKECGR